MYGIRAQQKIILILSFPDFVQRKSLKPELAADASQRQLASWLDGLLLNAFRKDHYLRRSSLGGNE